MWPSRHTGTTRPVGNYYVMLGGRRVRELADPRGASPERKRASLQWLLGGFCQEYPPEACQAIWHFVQIIFNSMYYSDMLNSSLF